MDKGILIDTNVLLELILNQEEADTAANVIDSDYKKYVSEFSIQSMFFIARKCEVDKSDIKEYFKYILKKVHSVLAINIDNLPKVYSNSFSHELDFDDAHI